MFTLKLATMREDGEPTRRRALRAEFSDEEWRLVTELADHPNRPLVTTIFCVPCDHAIADVIGTSIGATRACTSLPFSSICARDPCRIVQRSLR